MSTKHTASHLPADTPNEHKSHGGKGKLFMLSLAALGVVYGDIGTSPLYAVNEIFLGHEHTALTLANIYGCISLVLWALIIIVTIKYLVFVLRADNDGEGGVFSLYSLASVHKKKFIGVLLTILMLTAGLLFGDGIITPAISVLSAIEGLKVVTPGLEKFIVPITVFILTCLFAIQHKGTAKVGKVFGPIMVCWFVVLSALGLNQVIHHPEILQAFNPLYGINFLRNSPLHGIFIVLGSVMLTITGGEALYADMGHFGKKPIRISWFSMVFPALLMNYLGQGAYLLSHTANPGTNIFYGMVPAWGLIPMIILATCATIIASQALISGAFSIASQAIALNLFPRLKIVHTHEEHEGQIYISFINWSLYIGCILLVIIFKSSNALASAYGLAVSGDMLATSLAMMVISRYSWKWNPLKIVFTFGIFACIDSAFLLANSLKFFEGGFIPLSIGLVIFTIMLSWQWGRRTTFQAYTEQKTMKIKELVDLKKDDTNFIQRSMVLMAPKALHAEDDNTPALLQSFWDRYGILPKNIIFLNVATEKTPYLHENRYKITNFFKDAYKGSIFGVTVNFGFMEEPNIESILIELAKHHQIALQEDPQSWIVHVSQERLLPGEKTSLLRRLKLKLFLLLRQNSQPGYYYFGLANDSNLSMEIMPVKIH